MSAGSGGKALEFVEGTVGVGTPIRASGHANEGGPFLL